jgi:N-carbamoyl-L-amino-acid hydrolase
MPDNHSQFDGARVLADLNALRGIGAYKTGVHKPTFSEPHMRSLAWLAQQLPEAGLAATIDGIGNVLGTSTKSGPKLLAGSHLESQNFAGWLDGPLGVVYALEAARLINPDPNVNGAVEVASWCDEEGHFGYFLGSRSYVGGVTETDIDAARDRTGGRTMREALRDVVLPAWRASVPNPGGISGISRRISNKAGRSKVAISASVWSPRSSVSGNTGSPLAASKITPARPAWTFAGMPAWR